MAEKLQGRVALQRQQYLVNVLECVENTDL
jgi:hypothetical protein